MSDDTQEIEVGDPSGQDQPATGRSRLVLIGVAAALVVVAAAAGGAVAGHELWSSSRSASVSTIPSSPSPGLESKVNPALVTINSSFSFQGAGGSGTGIVVSSDGEVLTNNHVIDGATKVTATDLGNGKTYEATVVGYDPSHDIAVIKLQDASGLQTAKLGDSSQLHVGDAVTGIGNAGGTGSAISASGSITGLNQSITAGDAFGGTSERLTGLIETDANIQPGDSGGPLVDAQGRVIGMNTAGSAGFGYQGDDGGAFAIPISDALKTALQIVSGKGTDTVHVGPSAFIGVSIAQSGSGFGSSSTSNGSGLQIGGVVDGQPAQKAGLAAGDLITGFDGHSVASRSALSQAILPHHPGDVVKLDWVDTAGSSHRTSIVLGSGPPS